MASKKKLLQAAAGSAGGGATTDITDVFSTFLYDGTSATQNISNGINLGDNIAGSVDFDGAGDSLESTSHSFAYGTGDFTVEFWMYPQSLNSQTVVFGARANTSTGFMIGPNNSGEIRFYYNNAERIVDTGNALSINTWFHIAVTRASGTTKLFKNGTQVGSSYSDTNNYTSSVLEIGQRAISDGLAYDGLVSNVRVVLGTAVYTSNFTAPTEPLTAISGTELLICTSNNFKDEGPNKISFTVKGDPQVSSSSPFTGNTGEGGLVWIKRRDGADGGGLFDTVRGATKGNFPSSTSAEITDVNSLTSFNSNGFTVGTGYTNFATNYNGQEYVGWTWRKTPKFFDVVTYTGNGTARTISHNLGSAPGMILIKQTNTTRDWVVYHHSLGTTKHLRLNATFAAGNDNSGEYWGGTTPTSTQFSLGDYFAVNQNGGTYVAYLFAHNNGDGEFGPSGAQDVIKCGSLTVSSQATVDVNLGFEAQWVMLKHSSSTGNWFMFDVMRGMAVTGFEWLYANTSDAAEVKSYQAVFPTATGFGFNPANNGQLTDGDYIYMAIRRGPLAEPTSATDVFGVNERLGGYPTPTLINTGNVVDLLIGKRAESSGSGETYFWDRLRGGKKYLQGDSTAAETGSTEYIEFDTNEGFREGFFNTSHNQVHWTWKRAPGYFDVVAYTGGSGADTISHNLGVAPEMIWVKNRDTQTVAARGNWVVYHASVSNGYLNLHDTVALQTADAASKFGNGSSLVAPTSSAFTVADDYDIGRTGNNYIAYLFATVPNVSCVGSYTGTAATQTIDCGFSSGARFVLIKETNTTGGWMVFDTVRGIVSGNDARLELDDTGAESTASDILDPHSSGFQLPSSSFVNASGRECIFYAIA